MTGLNLGDLRNAIEPLLKATEEQTKALNRIAAALEQSAVRLPSSGVVALGPWAGEPRHPRAGGNGG